MNTQIIRVRVLAFNGRFIAEAFLPIEDVARFIDTARFCINDCRVQVSPL